eukprot:1558545-Amphidinium_carterae.1
MVVTCRNIRWEDEDTCPRRYVVKRGACSNLLSRASELFIVASGSLNSAHAGCLLGLGGGILSQHDLLDHVRKQNAAETKRGQTSEIFSMLLQKSHMMIPCVKASCKSCWPSQH